MAQKKKSKKKAKQTSLKLKVKTDAVGRAAKKYLKTRKAVESSKLDYAEASIGLVKVMRKEKRDQIKLEGVIVTLRHVEAQDMMKVTKPKER